MLHRRSVLALMAVAVFWFGTAGATAKYSTVRITLDKKTDYQIVRSFGFDVVTLGEGYAEAILAPGDLERLQSTGLKYTITIGDMTAFYRSRLDQSRSMGGYRTLNEIGLVLDSIYNAHPDIVTPKWSLGNSIEGRPIWVVKISDDPGVDEDEPEVYYYACHHAREVITPEVLIYFMRYLTNNYGTDPQVTYLLDNRELFFSPCLNPDGYYYNEETSPGGAGMWRKNRRDNGDRSFGVDINRNYGYQWGYDDDGSSPNPLNETYRGAAPFSEPETQAQRDFINARHFKVIANYHSYAGLFLYPWGYERIYSPDNDIFVQMGDTVRAMTGYRPGPPWLTLYPVNGGSFDWEYGEQTTKEKVYAVSIEVGNNSDGFWPPIDRITPLVQSQLQPNLFYARVAGNPEGLRAPVPPTIYAIGDVDTTYFQLCWHHFDQYNPAQSFEVWQMQNVARITDS
ncbi:MAG: M14 family metallopeptidase, partial [candidate division Zixibacteria bacterium]|nr:M14 family metallopeptidase [candidate division Zixibacteria bacterium]